MTPDLIIRNARVFQTFRQCFEMRDVAVAGERFYCISPALSYPDVKTVDARGRYMIPGLIDIHMHIESSMTCPAEFSRITLPYGVTTLVADAHEIANVFGMEGLESFLSQETEQDIFWAIPSSVPATDLSHETSGAALGLKEVKALSERKNVRCLGEIMNFKDLTAGEESRTRRMIEACLASDRGMRIEGHCPGLTGEDLNRFIYEGVDADHTQQTPQSVLEKTELGMFLELQLKSLTPEVVRAVCENELYENTALITDDTMADRLLEGQLNRIVESAVAAGMPVEKALYCATWTPARRMHLDDRGMIAPGKLADFFLLDDLHEIRPTAVYKSGKCVYTRDAGEGTVLSGDEARSEGVSAAEDPIRVHAGNVPGNETRGRDRCKTGDEARSEDVPAPQRPTALANLFPPHFLHSVRCRPAEPSDFCLRAEAEDAVWADVNVMKLAEFGTATTPVVRRIAVRDGELAWREAGLSLAVVYERHGKNGNIAYGLIEGAFTKAGAAATTWSHDSHNLLVLGTDPANMLLAQRRVLELQGGYVVYSGGEIKAETRLPIAGILSDQPVEVLGIELKSVREAMETLGYKNNNVIMSMSTLCLPVSPKLKLTDYGLLAVPSQERIPLVAGYGK